MLITVFALRADRFPQRDPVDLVEGPKTPSHGPQHHTPLHTPRTPPSFGQLFPCSCTSHWPFSSFSPNALSRWKTFQGSSISRNSIADRSLKLFLYSSSQEIRRQHDFKVRQRYLRGSKVLETTPSSLILSYVSSDMRILATGLDQHLIP
jgi:hypothetical protein